MNIFEKLPQEEIHQLWRYLNEYSDGSALPEDRMSYFLRFWNESKEPFYRMFGEEFILRKEVLFEKPFEELEDEMDGNIRWGRQIVQEFCQAFKAKMNEIFANDFDARYTMHGFVDNNALLVDNLYSGEAIVIPGQFTLNGRPLQVNSGCKVSKMVGKIADAVGVKVEKWECQECGYTHKSAEECCPNCGGAIKKLDGYEMFRQAHSLVLNQKKIKGTLCLSIHPLDFLTMSDNDCGWTSCMSWMEEYGDYRLGTIEMMNSPCVVIAYVEAKDKMYVCGRDWSNKRWRQLYVVTRDVILGNRQYPYCSDPLQGAAINWLRELCSSQVGWGPYAEETCQLKNNSWNTINGSTRVHFSFGMAYMYNDIYDYRLAYVSNKWENNDDYSVNVSGPAVCTGCGEIIEYETVEAHRVQCRACDGSWRCDCCGEWHSEYDESWCVGDYIYCDWCYHNELSTCECCGEPTPNSTTHVYIQVINTDKEEIVNGFNYNYYVSMCDECLDDEDAYMEKFGPIHEVQDVWGHRRKAFDVTKISDAGLQTGDLSDEAIEFIKLMRDAESDEERLNLIRKIAY